MKYYQSFTRGIYIEAGYMYLSYKCSLIYFARINFSEQYHIEGKAYKDERYDEHVKTYQQKRKEQLFSIMSHCYTYFSYHACCLIKFVMSIL